MQRQTKKSLAVGMLALWVVLSVRYRYRHGVSGLAEEVIHSGYVGLLCEIGGVTGAIEALKIFVLVNELYNGYTVVELCCAQEQSSSPVWRVKTGRAE